MGGNWESIGDAWYAMIGGARWGDGSGIGSVGSWGGLR